MRMLRGCVVKIEKELETVCIFQAIGVTPIEDKLKEIGLRCFGHVQ